jgi:hypothetical protein
MKGNVVEVRRFQLVKVGLVGSRTRVAAAVLRGPRPRVCYRCGWRSIVGKVRRYGLWATSCGSAYARLCDECVSDICRGLNSFQNVSSAMLHDYKP